jgi:hypothetical protein
VTANNRTTDTFHACRLAGLIDITVTGVVFNLLLDRRLGGLRGRIASLTSIARPTRRGSTAAGVHNADLDGASY